MVVIYEGARTQGLILCSFCFSFVWIWTMPMMEQSRRWIDTKGNTLPKLSTNLLVSLFWVYRKLKIVVMCVCFDDGMNAHNLCFIIAIFTSHAANSIVHVRWWIRV
jgi:hypothetical protein